MTLFGISLLLCIAYAAASGSMAVSDSEKIDSKSKHHPKFTGFPSSYEVAYTFQLPYTATFSPDPVKYDVRMWVNKEDKNNPRIRIDTANGLNKELKLKRWTYSIYPKMNQKFCERSHTKSEEDSKDRELPSDMSEWEFLGVTTCKDQLCEVFQLKETFFERTAYYTLYVTMDGTPVSLSALGQNYFSGSHFDEYLAEFTDYIPGTPSRMAFVLPRTCWFAADASSVALALQTQMKMWTMSFGDPYDKYLSNYDKVYTAKEYNERMAVFWRNKKYIDEHNRRNDMTYSLGLNRFADWTDEEFRVLSTGYLGNEANLDFFPWAEEEDDNDPPPEEFTWKGTPADGIVKDQGDCGSCWAFAATEALKGAWYVATNESITVSEQQLMDCGWNYGNNACGGGLTYRAIDFAVENRMADAYGYPYKGYMDYCQDSEKKSPGRFKKRVIVPYNHPNKVKKALVKNGPLAIAMDADHLDFRFYKSGVFSQPECTSRTDHALALVGYGKEGGMEYWELKNQWSTLWGDKGYIKIHAKYDCGITTEAMYAEVDQDAAKQRIKELEELSKKT